MARIFTRGGLKPGEQAESFALQDRELESMVGLFIRAGISMDIIDKLLAKSDELLSADDCRAFSKRIRTVLSLRMVVWSEEVPEVPAGDAPRSITPKLVSKQISKEMRAKCTQLVDFLAESSVGIGCTMHSGTYDPRVERTASKK